MSKHINQPFDVFISETEWVTFQLAKGRRAANAALIYPPGSLLLFPGEPITKATITALTEALDAGAHIEGIDTQNRRIEVISEPYFKWETTQQAGTTIKNFERKHPDYRLVWYRHDQITPAIANQVGDTNAYIWAGAPYYTFAFDRRNPDVAIPPWLLPPDIALPEKREYSLEELESIDLKDTSLSRWVERDLSRKAMAERFTDPGYLILIQHKQSNKIAYAE